MDAPARNPNLPGLTRHYRSVAGREVLFDNEGFLWHPEEWRDEVAVELARESGLVELGEPHWRVVRFLRAFYDENGRAPLNRQLSLGVGLTLLNLEALFPGGIKAGARRIAGLPNPKTCV